MADYDQSVLLLDALRVGDAQKVRVVLEKQDDRGHKLLMNAYPGIGMWGPFYAPYTALELVCGNAFCKEINESGGNHEDVDVEYVIKCQMEILDLLLAVPGVDVNIVGPMFTSPLVWMWMAIGTNPHDSTPSSPWMTYDYIVNVITRFNAHPTYDPNIVMNTMNGDPMNILTLMVESSFSDDNEYGERLRIIELLLSHPHADPHSGCDGSSAYDVASHYISHPDPDIAQRAMCVSHLLYHHRPRRKWRLIRSWFATYLMTKKENYIDLANIGQIDDWYDGIKEDNLRFMGEMFLQEDALCSKSA